MKLKVLILGYGEMGHAMEYLLATRHSVHIWSRSSSSVLEDEVAHADVILFCLPVNAHVEILHKISACLGASSLCLSIAKGLDESGMTAAQTLGTILNAQHRYGVVFGPMISEEISQGRLAFADVALSDLNDFKTIHALFNGTTLMCVQVNDMVGSSWSVILKNVYAIMFGIADELRLGDNMRGYLVVTALAELSSIVKAFGGNSHTPYSYAGLGDLIATATSEASHHHELGRKLASGLLSDISGEGIHTLKMVEKFRLFQYRDYPLYSLIHDIVAAPENLNVCLDAYLSKIKTW